MNNKPDTKTAVTPAQRNALASPMRMELLGLFTTGAPLSISDMAAMIRRPASSLYYHIDMLEETGFLQRAGTRPKGKRFETLYEPTATAFGLDVDDGAPESVEYAMKAMKSAFRMTERDLEAALVSEDSVAEGPTRNTIATRMHLRASPELLAKLNEHIDALIAFMATEQADLPEPTDDDQYLSLTFALLPLRGRNTTKEDLS